MLLHYINGMMFTYPRSLPMITFLAKISLKKVEEYARVQYVPAFLAHTKLEPLSMEIQETRKWGEPVHLLYTAVGRMEDHYLRAEEHAMKILPWLYENYLEEKRIPAENRSLEVTPIEDASLWHWEAENLCVSFAPCVRKLEMRGETLSPEDTYVSVSRQQVFVSYPVIRNYMAAWFQKIGLDSLEIRELRWEPSGFYFLLDAVPFYGKLVFSDMVGVHDLLYYAHLDQALESIHDWGKLDLDAYAGTAFQTTEQGVLFRMAGQGG